MTFDLRPALRSFLLADAAISTAVGGARIFPVVLPQGVRDASIVYTRISDIGDHHMQGPSGLARPRYQLDAWAADPDAAASLALLVKDRLDGFRGVMGSVTVQGIFADSAREDYDSESELYRTSQDFMIWFEEL